MGKGVNNNIAWNKLICSASLKTMLPFLVSKGDYGHLLDVANKILLFERGGVSTLVF